MAERVLVAVTGEWQCAKCDWADVPEHHRLCPKHDTRLKVEKVSSRPCPVVSSSVSAMHGVESARTSATCSIALGRTGGRPGLGRGA
jgi:hypothetical protein